MKPIKLKLYILFMMLVAFSTTNAQSSLDLTMVARNMHYGNVKHIAIKSDSVLFIANGSKGLVACKYNGSSIKTIAHIDDGQRGDANHVIISQDGTIFLANGKDGLRAYSFNGSTFINTAHINNGGSALRLAIDADGTIFLANYDDGLRAYEYTGTSFIKKGHVQDGGYDAKARDVAVDGNGTVFLANGDDGFRTYFFDGQTFTNTAHVNDGDAYDVEIGPDGTIFLGMEHDRIIAYSYNGNSLNKIAQLNLDNSAVIQLMADKNGILYFYSSNFTTQGLYAYQFTGTGFTRIAYNREFEGKGICASIGNTLFLANDKDGVQVFNFENNSFEPTLAFDEGNGGIAMDVSVGADGTIFLANRYDGIRSYQYDGSTLTGVCHAEKSDPCVSILSGTEDTVFVNSYDEICAYTHKDSSFTLFANIDLTGGGPFGKLAISPDGRNIYRADSYGGLSAFTFDGSSFSLADKVDEHVSSLQIAVNQNGTLFLANGDDGLRAYSFNGSTLTNTDRVNDGGLAMYVVVNQQGTIFLANGDDGLRAYTYSNSSLSSTAHVSTNSSTKSVAVNADNIVFVSCSDTCLYAYNFDGATFNYITHIKTKAVTHEMAIHNDGSIILGHGNEGISIYKLSGNTFIKTTSSRDSGFQLYPNPVKDVLYINNLDNSKNRMQYQILDLNCRTIKHGALESEKIELFGINKGIYILNLISDGKLKSKKFVLE